MDFNLEIKNVHIENDKWHAPFLLAASFQGLIKFKGRFIKNGVLYWLFSPKDKAELLIEQFSTKTEPTIPSKDLFEAVNAFWVQISQSKKFTNNDFETRKT